MLHCSVFVDTFDDDNGSWCYWMCACQGFSSGFWLGFMLGFEVQTNTVLCGGLFLNELKFSSHLHEIASQQPDGKTYVLR